MPLPSFTLWGETAAGGIVGCLASQTTAGWVKGAQMAGTKDQGATIDVVAHPLLRELRAYWEAKRQGRPAPRRADIDPTELPHHLPYLMLLEVEPAPLRFRYRLAGTNTYQIRDGLQNRAVTGRYVDEMQFHIASTETILEVLKLVVERVRPVYRKARFPDGSPRTGDHNMLAVPLATETGQVDMLLVCAVVTPAPAGEPPPVELVVL